jgi:AraC family transcriptional regulator
MSTGALMLGNRGSAYECSHQHGEGDRCLSFQFEPDFFERIAQDVGAKRAVFDSDRIPPLRALAPVSARARMAVNSTGDGHLTNSFEEIALDLVGAVLPIVSDLREQVRIEERLEARGLTQVLLEMEGNSHQARSLADLARLAGVSRYHFLRIFKRATGVTPHQWLLRTRLRHAAERLVHSLDPVTEVALDVGFDDLSNFIRSFRAEFGVSPSRYRTASKQ